MQDLCKLLKMAAEDEKGGMNLYEKIASVLRNKDDAWKIKQIIKDEKTHREEVQAIANRNHCNIL